MRTNRLMSLALAVLVFPAGCATTQENYKPVDVPQPNGSKITCDQPLNSFSLNPDAKSHLELAYQLKANVTKALAEAGSDGKFTGDLALTKKDVRIISQQSFDYMSFLYPLCMANAQGKLSDVEYGKSMIQLLDRFIKDVAAKVSINRTSDMSASNCANGNLNYVNAWDDVLTFSKPIDTYVAQTFTNSKVWGTQSAELWYVQDGKKVTPIPEIHPIQLGGERRVYNIPVGGQLVQIYYRYVQQADPADKEWGLSFVSSLSIDSISAKVKLPPGKEVSGLTGDASRDFKGCAFTAGSAPVLSCATAPANTPNVPVVLTWTWNVFDGC